MSASERLDHKLERIATLLEMAREIVAELESGETVETETDADHAVKEAGQLAKRLHQATLSDADE